MSISGVVAQSSYDSFKVPGLVSSTESVIDPRQQRRDMIDAVDSLADALDAGRPNSTVVFHGDKFTLEIGVELDSACEDLAEELAVILSRMSEAQVKFNPKTRELLAAICG